MIQVGQREPQATRPPKLIKPYVLRFCRGISKVDPVFVPCRPVPGKPEKECFKIVPEHVGTHGGAYVAGWAIWEWPKVLIEAEFHYVWDNGSGNLIDLTPRSKAFESILFLRDPKREYRGRQINNIRKPLSRDENIVEWIRLWDKVFEIMNEGDLADQHGEITIEDGQRVIKLYQRMAYLNERLNARYGKV